MAGRHQLSDGRIFSCADDLQELEDDIAGVLECGPSISDQLRVSAYGTDGATQTYASDIVELKELSSMTQRLTDSVLRLKKDLVVQKTMLQAGYERQVQEQAQRLHLRMNEMLRNLEEVHKEKLEVARRSYQQQLADALAVMRANYEKGRSGSGSLSSDKDTLTSKLQYLNKKLQLKQSRIEELEEQLLEFEESEPVTRIIYETEDDPDKERILEENEGFREEIDVLKGTIEELEESVASKAKEVRAQEAEVRQLKETMDKSKESANKLVAELEKTRTELEKEKSSSSAMLQKQNQDMKKIVNEKQKVNEEELRTRRKMEAKQQAAEKEREMLLLERQQLLLLQQQQQEQQKDFSLENEARVEEKKKMTTQLKKLQQTIEIQRKTIEYLRVQLQQNNRKWEKKFEILKHSLHAIKDEMFLRQSLQRQAASLHRVSVSYAVSCRLPPTSGLGHQDAGHNSFPFPALPLPGIGSESAPQFSRADFAVSPEFPNYSLKEDELQVVSDVEEDFDEASLLPSPPLSRGGTAAH